MAKFRVGDKVRDIRYGGRYEAKIVKVVPGRGMTMYTLDAPVSSNPSMYVAAEDEIEAANAACNANIPPELRRAYDEWQKAKAKLKKWWNPSRRLSERPPKGADEAQKAADFAMLFRRLMGRPTPNGYGNMTLEQMVASNAQFKVGDKVYIRWKDGQTEYGRVVGFKPDGKVIMAPDAFKGVGQIISEERAFHLANAEAARNAEPIPDLVWRIMKLYFKGKLKDAKALYQKNIGMRDLMMAYMKHEGMWAENLDRIFTNAARNAAGYVDADKVMISQGDAVVFKSDYRAHKDDDEWLDRNGDTVREVRGDEVKIGPSANDWVKAKDLMVWHNSRAVSRNAVVQKALNAANAATDSEFARLKAMGKAKALAWIKDNSQSLIDKYGYSEFVKLAKRIDAIRLKPIKHGRFAGKSGDMTYYVDYTNDRWFASKYGKDGTNVTELQVTGPYEKDPDGRERRHILYYYRSGSESIPAKSSSVKSLVASIMRGQNVVKQGDDAFAWNSVTENNAVVAKAMNAVALNGYVTIRRASGGTAQVREGDEVIYKGEKCRVLRLDDPVGHALIEDDGGREYTPRYSELKALNAVATNVKSYPFYVVDKAMKGKCIFSGRYELSDANDDVAELKKSGVESKAVPRRVLIMSGIDPDEESSWKKNHQKD